MSDALTPSGVGPSSEAEYLRKNWDPEVLGQYEGQWIAVVGSEVIMSHESFEILAAETISRRPLYAFVTFEDIQ